MGALDQHLKLLGLTRDALNMTSVRAAYRRLALQLHPDRGDEKAQFQAMQNAYEAIVEVLTKESGGTMSQAQSGHGADSDAGTRSNAEPAQSTGKFSQPSFQSGQATSAGDRIEQIPEV